MHAVRFIRVLAALLLPIAALAGPQNNPTAPPTPAASQPTSATTGTDRKLINAKVIEVQGDVRAAGLESNEWKPVKVGDEFPEQTRILTGVRSSVKFQIGQEEPYTCLLIDSVGKTVISEAAISGDSKKVRVGVAYGRVKGGVAEGGLKSDFTVDSPVATLSKRGTWGFSLYYERDTDAFEIGLDNRGLVTALNKATGQSRTLQPGERVTEAMRLWLDQQIFRNTSVVDVLGQSDITVAFNRIDSDGLGVLNVGSGKEIVLNLNSIQSRSDFSSLLNRALQTAPLTLGGLGGNQTRLRSEGFFGTGRGDDLIPVLIGSGDSLAAKGFAKPGLYHFRRDVAEAWLGANRK